MTTTTKLLAATLLAATATSALAESYFFRSSKSAPSSASVSASVGSATVRPGGAVSLPLTASNGSAPYGWKVAGALPPGISLSGDRILGSSTATGLYPFTVTATDRVGSSGTADGFVEILDDVTVVGPSAVLARVGGSPPSATYAATGVAGELSWSSSPSLPSGLSIGSSGTLSGVAAAAFNGTVRIVATDSKDGASGEVAVGVRAVADPVVSGSTVSVNQSGGVSASYTASNLLGTPSWSVEGKLPGGTTFDAVNGRLSGTANADETGTFTVKVRDGFDGAEATFRADYNVTLPKTLKWTYIQTSASSYWDTYQSCSSLKNSKCHQQNTANWCYDGRRGYGDLLFCQYQ